MTNKTFEYQEPFPLSEDKTDYYLLSREHVSTATFEGREMLKVEPEALTLIAQQAVHDASYFLRPAHQKQVAQILSDPDASENDKYVALQLLRNAEISAKGVLPNCQDTGTATIVAKKGQQVWTGVNDAECLSRGIYNTFQRENLRYSQNAALDMYTEVNTGTNLPAQIDILATEGAEYHFLFINKGGGSANKTALYQETKAILEHDRLKAFLIDKMKYLGTTACPPYHIAFCIGGTSPEMNLKTVKLASTKYYDNLPDTGNALGRAFRDRELEQELLEATREFGFGAQFGGKYFAHDIRVIRLPRHGGSCPIGLALSCSSDRNIKGKITKDGIWLEKLEYNPASYIPESMRKENESDMVSIDLNRPMAEILKELSKYPVSTRVSLSGPLIIARDIAHMKLKERLDSGQGLPQYFKDHMVYYAGPAKKPEDLVSGSLGPTTGNRMDPYVDLFQSQGGSMLMLAKGNRSQAVTDSCKAHGGFYLGSIGGSAAILAQEYVKSLDILEYPELGMEAVWKMEVEGLPAFILVDDKGNNFFEQVQTKKCEKCVAGQPA
ncbi:MULTISPECIES: fumarate hydratase [Morganella]|jgi:fumarate hydratase class I|uniref:Fumarate hydratase class I n=1 Tax=Morganella morganii TaxID=582 RepID=A0AAN5MHF9_MORMO|nr:MULTISPECIES: fumarate hydratase [Morganella]ELA9088972.1 fumarate hydratase [Morganella morganii]MCU6211683.1 fumarate hydratase [Morganella morganii]MCU6223770.1 fumarate hydratase [Morganella morganii]MCU6235150.1 fumarate hydratase [Morganella morganii]MCU6237741.1 fumarate hydratase [Morganella morganii]